MRKLASVSGGLLGIASATVLLSSCVADPDVGEIDEPGYDEQGRRDHLPEPLEPLPGPVPGPVPGPLTVAIAQDECNNGTTTERKEASADPTRHCTMAQLSDWEWHVCFEIPLMSFDPQAIADAKRQCDFIQQVLKPAEVFGGRVQCSAYIDDSGNQNWCADVADRIPDGTWLDLAAWLDIIEAGGDPLAGASTGATYLLAVHDDTRSPDHPLVAYWAAVLSNGVWQAKPIEASVGAHAVMDGGNLVIQMQPPLDDDDRVVRFIRFDPRGCGNCVTRYKGPNEYQFIRDYSDNYLDGFKPSFDTNNCKLTKNRWGDIYRISADPDDYANCADEKQYWVTGH